MRALNWIKNHLPTQRRLIQVYAALLYNANLKGYISGEIYTGSTKAVCVPGLNCYSCPGAVGACPLGALQNALASSGNRAPYYMLGILLLLGLTLGRTICGFLCPMGLLQELLHKIPTPKLKKGRITYVLSYLKYVILVVFVVLIPLWYVSQRYPVPAFCKYICPAGTFEGAIGLLSNPANAGRFSMLGILFTRKFIIMVLIFRRKRFCLPGFLPFSLPLGRDLRTFFQNQSGGREGRRVQMYPLRSLCRALQNGRPPCGRPRVYPLCWLCGCLSHRRHLL